MPFVGWKYRKDMQTQREGERERDIYIYRYYMKLYIYILYNIYIYIYIYIIYIYLHNKDHMIPPNLHTGPSKLGVIILSSNKAIELPWAPHSKGWSPDNLTSHCLGMPRARLVRTDLGVLRSDLVFRLTFKTKHSAGPCLALLGIQQQWKPHFPFPPCATKKQMTGRQQLRMHGLRNQRWHSISKTWLTHSQQRRQNNDDHCEKMRSIYPWSFTVIRGNGSSTPSTLMWASSFSGASGDPKRAPQTGRFLHIWLGKYD